MDEAQLRRALAKLQKFSNAADGLLQEWYETAEQLGPVINYANQKLAEEVAARKAAEAKAGEATKPDA